MKDLYDFSQSKEQHDAFYEKMKTVYMKIFARVGLGDKTYLTMSNGGSFSKYSFEFQTITDAGEDVIMYDEKKKIAINKDDYSDEILKDFGLKKEELDLKEAKSVEVGDIYTLGEKYSAALGLTYKDEKGEDKPVYMGSYGIGVPRLMGTIVEVFADEKGIVWPEEVSPYQVHLVSITGGNADVIADADRIYDLLMEHGIEVLYDDRDARAGEKFADSDLIGIPTRLVVSEKTMAESGVEVVNRADGTKKIISDSDIVEHLTR
jgi:prolyl-tRNA synthetase